ncbi:type II secretion system F family protein [Candidatus Saccharibacteria bacterium]|nr:type II secretion system F family protein [Candidatus Saccharibacteria bacterium]
MTTFSYQAIKKDGSSVSGNVEASERATAIETLTKQGLRPLTINEKKSGPVKLSLGGKKVKSDDLVIFTRELSAMVSAGVPLLRSLNSLEEHSENRALQTILKDIVSDVEGGAQLADALEKHPRTFNNVYVNMIRAGEAAGILDDILKRIALQQEKNATIRKKIKSAMTYPMVLISITILAFFGLMIFVIPQIGKIIKDLGGEDAKLPMLTTIMLNISSMIISYWWIVLPMLAGSVFMLLRFIGTPKGQRIFHNIILKLPGINSIIRKVAVARFARTFSALMGAGVSVLESLDVTAHAIGNKLYEEALIDAIEQVKQGAELSKIIEKNKLFPSIVAQMLSVGEETGQTDQVLVKVADFYEEEVDVAIDGLSSIIEPVMIVTMGAMVGLIAASVMMPIANLSNTIK